jgi:hypothetical protein
MGPLHLATVLLGVLTLGTAVETRAQEPLTSPNDQQARETRARQGGQITVRGQVIESYGRRLFSVRERGGEAGEYLVLAPRALSPTLLNATVEVEGTLRTFTEAELKRANAWDQMDGQTRQRFAGRRLLVANSVMAVTVGEPAPSRPVETPASPTPRAEPAPPPHGTLPVRGQSRPLTMRAGTLAAIVDEVAGREVSVLDARVVGVLEPHAFLIEQATTYDKAMGHRDRMLVLMSSGALRVPAPLLVGSTVVVTGAARTLLGMQVAVDAPWPAQLEPATMKRWEVRGAILATSVKTSDGVELTDRAATATAAR